MSAFIVTSETINCVVSTWYRDENRPCEQLDQIGQRLWKMNADAVAQRYGHANRPEELPKFSYRPTNYKLIQQYKSVQCLMYQCSEGDVPELQLYAELRQLKYRLAETIAQATAEYDSATWDLAEPITRRKAVSV